MKIVSAIPGTNQYPWDEWFDGQIRLLEPDVDFKCAPQGMCASTYNAANKRGLKVTAKIRPEGVYIQSLGPKDADDAAKTAA